PAVDLGHHLGDVHAPGDAVTVPAVGAGDGVPVVEVAADADRRRLLPRVQVDEPGDLTGRELRMHPFLELADGPHRPVDVQQVLFGQSLPLNRIGHVSPPWVWWIEASRPRRALAERWTGRSRRVRRRRRTTGSRWPDPRPRAPRRGARWTPRRRPARSRSGPRPGPRAASPGWSRRRRAPRRWRPGPRPGP